MHLYICAFKVRTFNKSLKELYTLQFYKLYQPCLNDSLFRKLLQHIRVHCINTSRRKWPFLTHPSTLMRLVTFP